MAPNPDQDDPIRGIGPSFRGLSTSGLSDGQRGIGPAARGIDDVARGLARRPAAPRRVAKAAATSSPPQPPANSRTIRIVDDDQLEALPSDVRTTAIDECKRIWGFVGKVKHEKAMTITLVAPDAFPETYAFSDGVVVLIPDAASLSAHLNEAMRLQWDNAIVAIGRLGVKMSAPSTRFAATPELGGLTTDQKQVVSAGKKRFALPFMASAVALDDVMSQVLDDVKTRPEVVDAQKRRKAAKSGGGLDARYVASGQSLVDIAVLSAVDNPDDPTKWFAYHDLLGKAIGRVMAHEIRHLYVPPHAVTGLGADSPLITDDKDFGDFSKDDKKDIIKAIHALEKKQKGATVVATFPADRHGEGFPF